MATEDQARGAYDDARKFFKDGLKSGNKLYIDCGFSKKLNLDEAVGTLIKAIPDIDPEDAKKRVSRRIENRSEARPTGIFQKDWLGNKTPVWFGEKTVLDNMKDGNCGVMACVAMYYATERKVPAFETFLVTAYNYNTSRKLSFFRTERMSFGHSWALLGVGDGQGFVVDPWAGVCCAENQFEEQFRVKMEKWASQGKRILVDYKEYSEWTEANHPDVLSLFAQGRTLRAVRGSEFFPAPAKKR